MLAFPYRRGFAGYHVRGEDGPGPGRRSAANASVEGAYLYDDVWRGAASLRVAFVPVEIVSRTSYLVEAPEGDPVDAMYLGDAAIMFVPAREREYTVRIGGGIRYMIDGRTPGLGRRDYAMGFDFGAGFDLFPRRPLVVSGRVDAGHLWKAWVLQARATVGVIAGPIELYAGYDHLQIARARLGGPVLGVRGWL